MYKTQLQEFCHQRKWSLPNYTSIKDGLDHNPSFKASVTINGVSFETPNTFKSSKEAQNEAAKLAFIHFTSPDSVNASSSAPSSPVSSSGSLELNTINKNSAQKNQEPQNISSNSGGVLDLKNDVQTLHKNQLQVYAQRRNISLPLYSCVREGPPHDSRFKATVTVDGETFEGPEFCRTLKEAEHAAARVALMSLSHNGIQEDAPSLYKNLLQEFTLKEGLSLPTYSTNNSGSSHLPTFVSKVEVGSDAFQGIAAKTKKQAEMNAAKVAYSCLKERKICRSPSKQSRAEEPLKYTSTSYSSVHLQNNVRPEDPLISIKHKSDNQIKGTNGEGKSSQIVTDNHHSVPSLLTPSSSSTASKKESDMVYARLRDPFPSSPSSVIDSEPSSPTSAQCSDHSSTKTTHIELPTELESYLLCNRVRVYPRKPNMVFAKGITVMPISDDKWVAVSLDFSGQEGN